MGSKVSFELYIYIYIYISKLVEQVINHVRKTAFVSVIKQWQWILILHENHWKAFLAFLNEIACHEQLDVNVDYHPKED